jgi:hypothetical protein
MKKIFSKKFSVQVFMLVGLTSFSLSVNAQTDPPKIIQPSPTTASLFRFQDYPMDYSTGLPQISIPIYEITSGSLSLPISISYHASGRKVYDQDGPVALGWSLNAGGSLSRTVHGTPDFGNFLFPYPFKIDNLTNLNDQTYLQKIIKYNDYGYCGAIFPFLDTEYDIFSYSIGSNSGKFIFKDNNNVKTLALLPYKPIVVTPINPSPGVIGFDIVDEKGITYKFSPAEFTQIDEYATTGWNLVQIISADKTDIISFTYTGGFERRKTINQTVTLVDNFFNEGQSPPSTNPEYGESTPQLDYEVSRLSEISFKQGKVKFNLVSGTLRLNNIQIINLNGEIIKTVQFNSSACYSQGEIDNTTNKLDGIEFKDKLSATVEKYSFEYYPIINSLINGPVNPRYRDWWGYYNNSAQHDMVPAYNVSYVGSGGSETISIGNLSANRQPSLEPIKSGVLKKITYPTGGSSEFIYELNKCIITGGTGSVVYGPGLRIYQIKSSDAAANISTKTFKYGTGESGYGFLELLPDVTSMSNEITIGYLGGAGFSPMGGGKQRNRYFNSDFYEEVSELAERPVLYPEVTEYNGNATVDIGKTVYKFDYNPWAAAGLFPKKYIYNFNYWNNPSIISQEVYKRNLNTYQKVKSIQSNYTSTVIENIRGLHVERRISLPQTGYGPAMIPGFGTPQPVCGEKYAIYNSVNNLVGGEIYSFGDYQIVSGFKNLTNTTETLYTDAGNITTTTSYTYNSKNLLSKKSTTNSKTELLTSDIKYPSDYTGIPLFTQMVAANMLSYPIEQFEWNNITIPVSGVRTNYFDWGTATPMIAPKSIDTYKGANTYETRLNYYGYDADGNPASVGKDKDVLSSYIWDYNKSYPVAEIKNASATDIAYTSFEADGTGNWTGQNIANIVSTGNTITGSKYYNFNGTTLTKAGLISSTNYIVSYWTKNGMYTVSGTPVAGWPKNLRSVTINGNTWTNWEHKVTGVSSVTVSGTGNIDELRLYPDNAFMTTYTFTPLVGMTSQGDVNNRVTYYEYDDYSRLKLIRDMNNNIIKTFNYQYQSSTP